MTQYVKMYSSWASFGKELPTHKSFWKTHLREKAGGLGTYDAGTLLVSLRIYTTKKYIFNTARYSCTFPLTGICGFAWLLKHVPKWIVQIHMNTKFRVNFRHHDFPYYINKKVLTEKPYIIPQKCNPSHPCHELLWQHICPNLQTSRNNCRSRIYT